MVPRTDLEDTIVDAGHLTEAIKVCADSWCAMPCEFHVDVAKRLGARGADGEVGAKAHLTGDLEEVGLNEEACEGRDSRTRVIPLTRGRQLIQTGERSIGARGAGVNLVHARVVIDSTFAMVPRRAAA